MDRLTKMVPLTKKVKPVTAMIVLGITAVLLVVYLIYGPGWGGKNRAIEQTIAYGAAGSPGAPRNVPPPGISLNRPLPNIPGSSPETPQEATNP